MQSKSFQKKYTEENNENKSLGVSLHEEILYVVINAQVYVCIHTNFLYKI